MDKVTRTEQINNKQIKIEENSEDEIFEAVKEMEFSLNNNWKIFKENYNLQKNFWQKLDYKKNPENIYISNYYLMKNEEFLN